MRALNEELQGGDFGGIGVYIVQDPRTHDTIISPIPDNPAIAAGVKPGDIVLAVDGFSARNQPLDTIEHRIRGQVGTRVVLLLQNPKDRAKRSVDNHARARSRSLGRRKDGSRYRLHSPGRFRDDLV